MRYLTCLCLTLSLVACDQSEAPKQSLLRQNRLLSQLKPYRL